MIKNTEKKLLLASSLLLSSFLSLFLSSFLSSLLLKTFLLLLRWLLLLLLEVLSQYVTLIVCEARVLFKDQKIVTVPFYCRILLNICAALRVAAFCFVSKSKSFARCEVILQVL